MAPLGKITDHIWLVRRMARATGSDLSTAMQDGEISNQDWSQMVTNCRGCACAGACSGWLDQHELDGTRGDAPTYCENRVTFDRLSRQPA